MNTLLAALTLLAPIYTQVFNEVDRTEVLTRLKEMTGYLPVTVDHQIVSIKERYSAQGKANFRKYWKAYYQSLGMQVQEFAYKTQHTDIEAYGHNLEAILPGQSPDSIVIIVHYDSLGAEGAETANPGVDDDMTGMATQLETARVLSKHKDLLKYTVRFVATDFEEWDGPGLEGARFYAAYLNKLAKSQNFKIIAGIDNEQSGWNCAKDGKCIDGSTEPKMLINDCANDAVYASPALSAQLQNVIRTFSSFPVVTECAGQDSDHYALWEIGIPALEFGEYSWQTNNHYDEHGGDFYEKIDEDYFFTISRLGIVFAATQAHLD